MAAKQLGIALLLLCGTAQAQTPQLPKTHDQHRLDATEQQRHSAASEATVWYARFQEALAKIAELEKAAKACKPITTEGEAK